MKKPGPCFCRALFLSLPKEIHPNRHKNQKQHCFNKDSWMGDLNTQFFQICNRIDQKSQGYQSTEKKEIGFHSAINVNQEWNFLF